VRACRRGYAARGLSASAPADVAGSWDRGTAGAPARAGDAETHREERSVRSSARPRTLDKDAHPGGRSATAQTTQLRSSRMYNRRPRCRRTGPAACAPDRSDRALRPRSVLRRSWVTVEATPVPLGLPDNSRICTVRPTADRVKFSWAGILYRVLNRIRS